MQVLCSHTNSFWLLTVQISLHFAFFKGRIEVWITRGVRIHNNGFRGRREAGDPPDILLLHTNKQPEYQETLSRKIDSIIKTTNPALPKSPLQNGMDAFTHSGYVDSFSDKFNISEIKEQVLHFGASGEVLLHIRHDNLTKDEMMKRGGDKFKLYSIRVC